MADDEKKESGFSAGRVALSGLAGIVASTLIPVAPIGTLGWAVGTLGWSAAYTLGEAAVSKLFKQDTTAAQAAGNYFGHLAGRVAGDAILPGLGYSWRYIPKLKYGFGW